MKRHLRSILAILIVAVTIFIVVRYMQSHPEILTQLKQAKVSMLLLLIGLYAIWFMALIFVLIGQLQMLGVRLGRRENVLLNAYSSLINFFGPGQSGPGARAIYLKKKHKVRIVDFTFMTLIYYACYALMSACMLFAGSRPWWQTLLLVIGVGGFSFTLLRIFTKRSESKSSGRLPVLQLKPILIIFCATFMQLCIQALIYSIELSHVNGHTSFGQVISYTGAANFSLFVSITPGAIGIREAFLAFSSSLHGISNVSIVAANLIDRAAYLAFLSILLLIVVSLHAKKYLGNAISIRKSKNQPSLINDIVE